MVGMQWICSPFGKQLESNRTGTHLRKHLYLKCRQTSCANASPCVCTKKVIVSSLATLPLPNNNATLDNPNIFLEYNVELLIDNAYPNINSNFKDWHVCKCSGTGHHRYSPQFLQDSSCTSHEGGRKTHFSLPTFSYSASLEVSPIKVPKEQIEATTT